MNKISKIALLFSISICFLPFLSAKAQVSYNVYGVAGQKALQGATPKDSVTLISPYDLTFDKSDNLYILDKGAGQIYKANSSGVIQNIIGNGSYGIYGVAVNPNNNHVFVTDQSSHWIIEYDSIGNFIKFVTSSAGVSGFSGDGLAASTAKVNSPAGICFDNYGNILFADQANNRIRKISTTGIISTIAGTGAATFGGDNGLASACQLNSPSFVTVDYLDNIYIADNNNHRIRKIDATTNKITTIAGTGTAGYFGNGTPATSAMINFPKKMVYDSTSNSLFFSDQFNFVVRKINLNTGVINAVAGSGVYGNQGDGGLATSAQLSYPRGLAKDKNNNIYIADNSNRKVRKVNLTNNIITSYIGNGSLFGDGHHAEYAQYALIGAITQDNNGNLFVADDYRIRKINSQGIISLYAGRYDSIGYSGDGGLAKNAKICAHNAIASDNQGNIYFSQGNISNYADTVYCIRKINASTGIISTITGISYSADDNSGDGGLASIAKVGYISSIAIDNNNNLYLVGLNFNCANHSSIRKIDASTGKISTIAGNATTPGSSGDGGLASAALLNGTRQLAFCNNALYLTDNNVVRKIDFATNKISTYDSTGLSAGTLNHLWVSSDGVNNIYMGVQDFTTTLGFQIQQINTVNNTKTTIFNQSFLNTYSGDGGAAISAGSNNLQYIASNSSGSTIYLNDENNIRVLTTLNMVSQQPITQLHSCFGDTSTFTSVFSNPNITSYNWQIYNSSTSSYLNLQNNALYSGVNTPTLTINSTNSSLTNNLYRCVAQGFPIVETKNGKLTVHALPTVHVNNQTVCFNNSATTLTATGANTYSWSNSMTGSTISVAPTSSQSYTVTGVANFNCKDTAVAHVTVITPSQPTICVVTVDTGSIHNVIVWDKTPYNGIATSFNVYRDYPVNTVPIANIPYDSLSQYIDTALAGDPNNGSRKYSITLIDTCGNESVQSDQHRPVFIAFGIQPQDFNIQVSYQINGTTPAFLTYYTLYQDKFGNGASWDSINYVTVGSPSISAPLSGPNNFNNFPNARYRVEPNFATNCTPTYKAGSGNNNTMVTVTKSRSNIRNNRTVGVKTVYATTETTRIYPNPSNTEFTVELSNNCNNYKIEIVNMLGATVKIVNINTAQSTVNTSDLENGIYYIKISSTNKPGALQKLVVQH